MTLFIYRAKSLQNKIKKGLLQAENTQLAQEKLRADKLLVLSLTPYRGKRGALRPSFIRSFTAELAELLSAKLSLYESLLTLAESYSSDWHKQAFLLELCAGLKQGHTLATLLQGYHFTPLYISLVKTGEESGSLALVFNRLAQFLLQRQKLQRQLFAAMAYPVFLGVFSLALFSSLLLFVIPSLRELFEGRKIHPFTQAVFAISQWTCGHQRGLAVGLLLILLGGIWLYKKGGRCVKVRKVFCALPFLKEVLAEKAWIPFCRALATLLTAGLPLTEALSLASPVMAHPFLEKLLHDAERKMREGVRFSEGVKGSVWTPPLLKRMVTLAEETGEMALMLEQVATVYEEHLERRLLQFTQVLQPLLLLFMGVIVAILLLSVLLPLTDVSSFYS